MGFLDVLFQKSDKSRVLRFYLTETDSDELARCRKREPVIFRSHPEERGRVLVFHKIKQGSEAKLGAVPGEMAQEVAEHLEQGFLCEGTILQVTYDNCRVKCRLIAL